MHISGWYLSLACCITAAFAALPSSKEQWETRMHSAFNVTFGSDRSVRLLLVKHFDPGDFLLPTLDKQGPDPSQPLIHRSTNGATVLKFFIRTNDTDAPEQPHPTAGTDVGFELWFPDPSRWNGRIYNEIVGGFQGDFQVTSLDYSSSESWKDYLISQMATELGYVSGVTNGGQINDRGVEDMQWLLNADGSWNMEGWKNANWQAHHLLAVHSKALTTAFYGKPAKRSYVYGCSTGGRAVYKLAQLFPEDHDGLIASSPSITQTRLFPSLGHPYIVQNNHLNNESRLTDVQFEIVVQRALQFGDTEVTGHHDGYFSTMKNSYDATKDMSLLSIEDGGNCTADWAFSLRQLEAVNMIWYGPTIDGEIPSPSEYTGVDPNRPESLLWWGKLRGTRIDFANNKRLIVGNMFAVMLRNVSLAPETWNHPLGVSSNAWDGWSYKEYAKAIMELANIDMENFSMDSDDPDILSLRESGAKMLTYHAFADPGVAPQSGISYYHRSTQALGGGEEGMDTHRLFLVPGQDHCVRARGVAGNAEPPIPTIKQWLDLVVDWVEEGVPPEQVVAYAVDNTASRPLCVYPNVPQYDGKGHTANASSFSCPISK